MKTVLISTALIGALALPLTLTGCKDKSAETATKAASETLEAKASELEAGSGYTAEAKTSDLEAGSGYTAEAEAQTGGMPMMSAEQAAAYIKANGARDGVITTASGLQYTINRSGDAGGVSPKGGQKVKVHYEGKFTNGTVFDSSYERGKPAVFPSDQLIPGWVEALSIMKPGDEWTLHIAPDLGYGPAGLKDPRDGTVVIPENAVLIFRMELLENM